MKKKCLLVIAIASLMMSSCMDDLDFVTKTTYTGHVVNEYNVPLENKKVSIGYCDGRNDFYEDDYVEYIATTTNENGDFSLTLDYQTSNNDYGHFLAIVEGYSYYNNAPIYFSIPLVCGKENYDYGTIVIK